MKKEENTTVVVHSRQASRRHEAYEKYKYEGSYASFTYTHCLDCNSTFPQKNPNPAVASIVARCILSLVKKTKHRTQQYRVDRIHIELVPESLALTLYGEKSVSKHRMRLDICEIMLVVFDNVLCVLFLQPFSSTVYCLGVPCACIQE